MRPTTRTIALYVLIAMSLLSTLSMNAAMAGCFNALSLIVLAIPQRRTPRHLFD